MSDLSIETSYLVTAILRYLCDEKKLLTQSEVDDILNLGETYRKNAEAGFQEYLKTTPAERKKAYRHLNPVSEVESET